MKKRLDKLVEKIEEFERKLNNSFTSYVRTKKFALKALDIAYNYLSGFKENVTENSEDYKKHINDSQDLSMPEIYWGDIEEYKSPAPEGK